MAEIRRVPRLGEDVEANVRILLNHMTIANNEINARFDAIEAALALAAALVQLTQTITSPPTQAEVTAIQDKVNAIIAALAVAAS